MSDKKNLVILRAGDNSLHESWLEGPRNWDFLVSCYGENPNKWKRHDIKHLYFDGGKFDGIYDAFQKVPGLLDKYDYIMMADDDFEMTTQDINRIFEIMREENLQMGHPSFSYKSHGYYFAAYHNPCFKIRFTNFVEQGIVCMTPSVWRQFLPLLENNPKAGYTDYYWSRLTDNPAEQVALIDEVQVTHTKPYGNQLNQVQKKKGWSNEGPLKYWIANWHNPEIDHWDRFKIVCHKGRLKTGIMIRGRYFVLPFLFIGWLLSALWIRRKNQTDNHSVPKSILKSAANQMKGVSNLKPAQLMISEPQKENDPPVIASWWHGWRMSWIEQLCLRSFVAKGHKVILYTNGEVDNVPEGVEQRPDTEIWNPGKLVTYQGSHLSHLKGSLALHTDLFRYHLLHKTNYIWADTDAYCHQQFPNLKWIVARDGPYPTAPINGGVLRLPKYSQTLKLLVETFLTQDGEYPILRWKSKKNRFLQKLRRKLGLGTHVSKLDWAIPGPTALMKYLEMTGEIGNTLPSSTLYPLAVFDGHYVFDSEKDFTKRLADNCLSVHLYTTHLNTNSYYKSLIFLPPEDSWLLARARELGVNPADAPERIRQKPQPRTTTSIPKKPQIIEKNLPVIASWWHGWRMSWVEQLCLQSFVAKGHKVILYTNGEVDNVPQGVEQRPDTEIWNPGKIITYQGDDWPPHEGSPALHTDFFRYHLMQKTDYIWVDTDAYCHQPFPNTQWYFARHTPNPGASAQSAQSAQDDKIAAGVMRMPKDSQTLKLLTETFLTQDGEHPILPWESATSRFYQRLQKKRGHLPTHVSHLAWGSLGPIALTNCLKMTGEIEHALPAQALYPLAGEDNYRVFQNEKKFIQQLPHDCLSVHLFTSNLQASHERLVANPPKDSWLVARARELGIEPAQAPKIIKNKPPPNTQNKPDLPVIASWWHGWRMSWIEQLCLRSFVAKGHKVILYTNGKVDNIPEGVEQRPDTEIWHPGKITTYEGDNEPLLKGNPALHTDLFRYHLLKKTDYIWVDTDAYCHQPFPNEPWYFAKHAWGIEDIFNGGVLRLPKESKTLQLLIETFANKKDEYPILPWTSKKSQARQRLRKKLGLLPHISQLDWATPGPLALTKFLYMTGEASNALHKNVLYPLLFTESYFVFDQEKYLLKHLSQECLSVHLYTSHLRAHHKALIFNPPKDSWLFARARDLDINPADAPEIIKDRPA